ncbi:unnamed protein product [Lathyrus oleraceus]
MDEHKQSCVENFEKFTWKVENFSFLDTQLNYYSEPFVVGGYPWKILLYKRGDNADDLSLFLSVVETANMSNGWSRHVKFRLLVFNQHDSNKTIISDELELEFNARLTEFGLKSFVSSTLLHDSHSGFLVKDVCIVGAKISIYKSKHEKEVSKDTYLNTSYTSQSQAENLEVEGRSQTQEKVQSHESELVDFKGLGQIEKAFVPLLEEACTQQPSLIVSQQKRSGKFMEWAFMALGRVLYFLKTKKVKDMNDLACKELQMLWEELELFSFDLTWLEPRVQSALRMKSYLEKLDEAQKLKNTLVVLELEIERLKSKIDTLDVSIHAARELMRIEDLEETDLEA